MHKTRTHFLLSLIDQCAVSGANFLTIALGAAFLPIGEQGKLVYAYTAYIALVLFNIATFFSAANIVCREVESRARYRHVLLTGQTATALMASALALAGLLAFREALQWRITAYEAMLLLVFFAVQQIADFLRRSGYVFDRIGNATLQSLWLYGIRIGALLYFRPQSVTGLLLAMLLPAVPLALIGLGGLVRSRSGFGDAKANADLVRFHLSLSKWNIYKAPIRWAGLHLPILLAGALHSVEAAAILGTIRAITTFANVLLEMLETFVPAWLSSKLQRGEAALRQGSRLLLYFGLAVWLAGALAIALFGEAVIAYMLGADYRHYTPILYIIWGGNGIYFAGRAIGLHYRMRKNLRFESVGLTAGAVALPFVLPLIALYGAWGGAWCLMIVQIATLAGLLGYGRFADNK